MPPRSIPPFAGTVAGVVLACLIDGPITDSVATESAAAAAPVAAAADTDRAAIEAIAVEFARAFEAADVDRILAQVTDDFVAMTPDKPAIHGKERVRRNLQADLATMKVDALRFVHEEIVIIADWAFARGTSIAVITDQGTKSRIVGKYLWILQRQRTVAGELHGTARAATGQTDLITG